MPVRTIEQAHAALDLSIQIELLLGDLSRLLPVNTASIRHPEMLEEIHWDLSQIRGRLRLAVTGEYDAV